jgi:acyl-CoA synthetase (AMP-forming)/AMP-acid ligase II
VPLEYHKDPEKTAVTFVTGPDGKRYALAGDLAVHEADGTITLLGRGSQCINSGGEKIFPEEVESAVKSHPSVRDVIVVGVPDERWGQAVAAVVQPAGRSSHPRGDRRPLPRPHRGLQGAPAPHHRRRGGPLPQRQARLPVGAAHGPRRRHRLTAIPDAS